MANVFKIGQEINNEPKRNNFDLFHQNHLTIKPGMITPILCKPVVPGDSFRIKTSIGLKFMPMPFPVQSHMRAVIHYFYCRNKNLWKNWQNFIQGLEEHTHPYIDQPNEYFKTSTLADYLGVPTTVVSGEAHEVRINCTYRNIMPSYPVIPTTSRMEVEEVQITTNPEVPINVHVENNESMPVYVQSSQPMPTIVANDEQNPVPVSVVGSEENPIKVKPVNE